MKQKIVILSIVFLLVFFGVFLVINTQKTQNLNIQKNAEINLPTGRQAQKMQEVNEIKTEEKVNSQEQVKTQEIDNKQIEKKKNKEKEEVKKVEILDQVDLSVPFTSQAPYANWADPWQEACEEASLIMIDYYWQKKQIGGEIPKKDANDIILDMVGWQEKNWGGHDDLKTDKIAKLAKDYFGYKKVEVKYDISIEDIKAELSKGNPVLMPTAGRLLANPYFTAPGPVYHNLVVVGYDSDGFIVNDSGVWQGYKFRYSFDNLYNAIHDYVDGASKANPEPILGGRKAMVVIN